MQICSIIATTSAANAANEVDNKPVVKCQAIASSRYTEEEKRVLNHTSNINENIFVPFMEIDLKDRFVFSIPFTDKVFFKDDASYIG